MKTKFHRTQCFLMLLCGIGVHIDFFLFGRLTVADTVVVALLPLTALHLFTTPKPMLAALFFLSIYFASGLVSALSNSIPTTDTMKGLAKPTLMFAALSFFTWTIRTHPRSLFYYIMGNVLGSLILFFAPGMWTAEMASKSEYGNSVARLVPLLSVLTTPLFYIVYRRSQLAGGAFLGLAAVTRALIGASRGQIATTAVSSFALILPASRYQKKPGNSKYISVSNLLTTVLIIIMASTGLLFAYPAVASKGWLGANAKAKYLAQSQDGELNAVQVLFRSRSEVYAAYLGILDHPIVGVGSWNREATGQYLIESSDELRLGRTQRQVNDQVKEGKGAGHSILLQEWLEQGIGAAMFWLFSTLVISTGVAYTLKNQSLATAFYTPSAVGFFVSLWISPLDHITRIVVPLMLCIAHFTRSDASYEHYFRISFDFTCPWREIFSSKDARLFIVQRRDEKTSRLRGNASFPQAPSLQAG